MRHTMKRTMVGSQGAQPGDVIDAVSFNELVVSTYKKNLGIRQRKERSGKKY